MRDQLYHHSAHDLNSAIVHAGEKALHLQGDFTWEESAEPSLTNLDAEVKSGELMVVVGPTGSGKSSLLGAALGLMQQVSGDPVNLRGKASNDAPFVTLNSKTKGLCQAWFKQKCCSCL